ncbi:MAG: MBL fold metallo-hydrolase, partial [Clostridia bacterium]|nr:MBL fold metallo-hydrolase [Clostridia bacterium]
MKVTVLGNNGPYPSAGGACSGYLIQSGNTSILNDIGPGSLANLFKVMNPADLNAIVLSHLHYDHISDLYSLGYYFSINKKVMDLFLPDHPRDIYEQFKNNKAFNVFPICDCNMFHIKEITLTFCEMTHPLKSYASKYRDNVSTFVYSGDTNYNERLGEFGRKCDL